MPYVLRVGEEQVLSRWNMVEQSLYVSRIQAVVHVMADGQPLLVSSGRAATLWRAAYGAPWSELHKDESITLSNGMQVSLDCRNPEGAVFTCQESGTQQIPYPWEALVDEASGAFYYSNPQTGAMQWDPPAC